MGGSILGGEGDDAITVGSHMSGGSIDGGDGDDTITLNGPMMGGSISGGAGNDRIILNGVMYTGTILDGGENDALLLPEDVGDILSLGRAQAVAVDDLGVKLGAITAAKVTGFESLHLDLLGGDSADTLFLENLMNNLDSRGFTDGAAFEKIIVTGDAALDTVNFAGLSSFSRGAENVSVEGFSQSFTEYQVTHNDQTLTLLLQSDLL
jgi:hypothetical protein